MGRQETPEHLGGQGRLPAGEDVRAEIERKGGEGGVSQADGIVCANAQRQEQMTCGGTEGL